MCQLGRGRGEEMGKGGRTGDLAVEGWGKLLGPGRVWVAFGVVVWAGNFGSMR
jgi:hypothetical protein